MTVLDSLRDAAPAAFAGEPVAFAYLFGSHATGRARPDSDIDVAVVLSDSGADPLEASLRLPSKLERASGLTRIEVVVLDGAPLPVKGRAVTEGRLIFSADEPARVRFEGATQREFFDFEIHAAAMRRDYLRNVAEGRA